MNAPWYKHTAAKAAFGLGGSLFALAGLFVIVPDLDGVQQKYAFAALLVLGIFLVDAWPELATRRRKSFLAILCVLAVGTMFRWSEQRLRHVDHHDVTCYYLGGKYAPELGPFELYPAAVLADRKNRRWLDLDAEYWAQSREGFERRTLRHALSRGREVRRQNFTEERWEAFERDVLALQDQMGKGRFRVFFVDKGFNATPAWIAYAKPLIEKIPVERVLWLTMIDVVLLGGAFLFVATTFGSTVALFGIFFFCTTISTKWLIPGSIILRYDWVAALLVAMCLVQRATSARSSRSKGAATSAAGALVALAGLLRVFPVVWMFGAAAKVLTSFFEKERQSRWKKMRTPLLSIAVFSLVLSVGEVSAIAVTGVESARDHAIKMIDHTSPEMISSKRPGLAIATSYDWQLAKRLSQGDRARIVAQKPITYALAALLLGGYAWALRRKSDVEAFSFGYVPFFLLSTGTYYYHIARLTLVLNHALQLDGLRHRASLLLLFSLEIFSQIMIASFGRYQLFWTSILSWGLLVYCIGNLLWMAYEQDRGASSETTDPLRHFRAMSLRQLRRT